MIKNLNKLTTESRNINTMDIDRISTEAIIKKINDEDKKVALAVEKENAHVARAVDVIFEQVKNGGRLIYIGAGTSGRLGILDASECPPTYGVSEEVVKGLIAGGHEAIFRAVEGAEDDTELAKANLEELDFSNQDVLVGIAASGRTPYVIGGLKYANSIGAPTISLTCNPESEMSKVANISIAPVVGPEVVTGSTRMKAGTAQKMVLNMLTTATMIKLGKVYENLMVDVQSTNEKLINRCKKIVMDATGVTIKEAEKYLDLADYHVKLAILIIKTGADVNKAKEVLRENEGYLVKSIEVLNVK